MWFEAKFEVPSIQSQFWYWRGDDLKWFEARFEGWFDQLKRTLNRLCLEIYWESRIVKVQTSKKTSNMVRS